MAIQTGGGAWKTSKYAGVKKGSGQINDGCEIVLDFRPNNLVQSKKIGLIQKAQRKYRAAGGDSAKNPDKSLKDKEEQGGFMLPPERVKAQRTDGVGHVDRGLDANNPIYGAKNLDEGSSASDTPKSKLNMDENAKQSKKSNYQLGHRYKKLGRVQKRDARLYDQPNMPSCGNGSEMLFETTAISLEGSQKNTYYGSVTWGWRITDGGRFELLPLEVKEMGSPSEHLRELSEIWNQAHDKEGGQNIAIPTTGHTGKLRPNEMGDLTKVVAAIDELNDDLRGDAVRANDKKNMEFELKFLKAQRAKLQAAQ